MEFYSYYYSKNSKNIMITILWKLRTETTCQDILKDICHWQIANFHFNHKAIQDL